MTNCVTCRNPSPPCLGVSRSYAVPWSSYTGGRPRPPNPEVSLLKSHWLVGWAGAWYKGLISWPMWGCSVNPPSLICHPLGWTCYLLTEYARWASISAYSGGYCHNAAGIVLPSLAWTGTLPYIKSSILGLSHWPTCLAPAGNWWWGYCQSCAWVGILLLSMSTYQNLSL